MMITIEEKMMLKNHANRNITRILDHLNIKYSERSNVLQAICPALHHGGDRTNTSAFSWKVDAGIWCCWSHHCEEYRGCDIFGLVGSVLGKNFYESLAWTKEFLAKQNVDLSVNVTPVKRDNSIYVHEPLKEDNLKFLKQDPEYLIRRGFSKDVLREYNVGFWHRPGTYMHDRVVVPIRDQDGFLVGYSGRTIHSEKYFTDKGLKFNKWIHGRYYNQWPRAGDLKTSSLLLNLFKAKHKINPHKTMIVVEGPLDGFKLEMAGITNWVATLGTSFSNLHRSLLVKYGVNKLKVAYDNDENSAGDDGWVRLKRICGDLFELERVELPLGSDCGSLSVEQLKELINVKIKKYIS